MSCKSTQICTYIEGGDLVDDVVTCLSQKLRIRGKLGRFSQREDYLSQQIIRQNTTTNLAIIIHTCTWT